MELIEIDNLYQDITFNNCAHSSIRIIEKCELNYKIFFENFMLRNLPCIIKNVSSTWECTKKWTTNNGINLEYLKQKYGDLEAPVAICDSITYNAHNKINMKVNDYVEYMEKCPREKLLYLKDWHLKRLKPNDEFYEVPIFFALDWLNEFAIDHKEDDFMFVYIGPKDSWTPLHADVYSSYSWSVNIVGRKKWTLFPPGEEDKLRDTLGNLPLDFNPENFRDIKYFDIIQESGDAIFVPSGWYHQVINLLDTISINHNWINACNIEMVWNSLNKNLSSVENEIKEFENTPEFTSQCQLILKSVFGMDFSNFLTFICYLGEKRLSQLKGNNVSISNKYRIGKNYIRFDLHSILKIIDLINNHYLFKNKKLTPNIENDLIDTKYKISELLKCNINL